MLKLVNSGFTCVKSTLVYLLKYIASIFDMKVMIIHNV